MTQDPCLIPALNPSLVFLDLEILKFFDKRPSCPLFWDNNIEFIIDPKIIMNVYSLNSETYAPGVAWNLSKLCGKSVLFKRSEKNLVPNNRASAPGYFRMYIKNENGEWVTPYPDYEPFNLLNI